MQRLPTLKQLEYLVALAETRHFGHAAGRCFVTQSSLSAGIRDLESVLGAPVAERSKRHVLMTPLGASIAEKSKAILMDTASLVELAQSSLGPMTGEMRLGVIPTISPFLLPRVLPMLNQKYPALTLFLREEQTAPLLTRLREGEVDVALVALPYETTGLEVRTLMEDEFVFACREDHQHADRDELDVDDLADEALMLLEEGHCLRGHVVEALPRDERYARRAFEATSLATLVQMVGAGIGVTLLPKLAVDADITRGTAVRTVALSFSAARKIALVWRSSSAREVDFNLLAAEITACVGGT